jgi:hypothetical protein
MFSYVFRAWLEHFHKAECRFVLGAMVTNNEEESHLARACRRRDLFQDGMGSRRHLESAYD